MHCLRPPRATKRGRRATRPCRRWLVGALCACVPLFACANGNPPWAELEAGGIYYDLDSGFASTAGGYLRGRLMPTARDLWYAELVQLDRFDDSGMFIGVGNVHHFNDRWYSELAVGTSTDGFFWPRVRVDTKLSRKWFSEKNFVSTIGVSYYDAKDAHSDAGISIEGIYYTASPWIIQMGTTVNESDPGSVVSASGYGALTHLLPRFRQITLRVSGGHQAYQAFTEDNFEVDFPFYEFRLTWKQWLGKRWGVNVAAASYQSDVYDQRGGEAGFFMEF